jgi:hypothetical protein
MSGTTGQHQCLQNRPHFTKEPLVNSTMFAWLNFLVKESHDMLEIIASINRSQHPIGNIQSFFI